MKTIAFIEYEDGRLFEFRGCYYTKAGSAGISTHTRKAKEFKPAARIKPFPFF